MAGTLVWLIVLIGSAVYLADRWQTGVSLSSDLLALLPGQRDDEFKSVASKAATDALARDAVFVFGHPDRRVAERAASDFARDLGDSGLVAEVSGDSAAARFETLGKLLFAHRAGLLSEGDRESLLAGQAPDLYRRALAQIFSPIGTADSRLLLADPFQLFRQFVGELGMLNDVRSSTAAASAAEGDVQAYAVVTAKFKDEPYALSFQNRFVAWFEAWRTARGADDAADGEQLEILHTGAIFYAHAGAKQGLDEATVIGGITVFGLIVLVLLAFGSLQPIWLSLLSIVSGLTVALAVNLLLFENLHFVAVMFGAGLIGVSVDYSFHYCCERFGQDASSIDRLQNVLPGATLGVITSVIGFLTLAWAPFPGLRQIALFSAVGLAVAYFTVVIWFPVFDRSPRRRAKPWLIWVATFPRRLWRAPGFRFQRRVFAGLIVGVTAIGGWQLSFSDDVRTFQALSPDLKAQENAIRDIAGLGTGLRFFIVTGASDEEILQREEGLREQLNPLRATGAIAGLLGVSMFVPSAARQAENQSLIRHHLGAPMRRRLSAEAGLPLDVDDLSAGANPLTLETFLAAAPRTLTDHLVPDLGPDRRASIVILRNARDDRQLEAVAESLQDVAYVDPVSDVSTLFRHYRKTALLLLGLSILLMAPVLLWRYGARGSVRVLVPPVASVSIAPCVVALTGEPLTFFNIMALILVFAVGIDYALFCREAAADRLAINALANGLAATTTVLSFGLLAFSQIPVVHSFGLTVFVGILVAFFLAPLAEQTWDEEAECAGSA